MYSRERFESEFRSLLLDEMNFVFGETCRHVLMLNAKKPGQHLRSLVT